MKILMATMGMNIGGAETHILELSKELKHQGHDVIIVSNGGVYVPEIEAAGHPPLPGAHAPPGLSGDAPFPDHSP